MALGKHSVVLLAGHGAVTVSTEGPEECIMNLMLLEQVCKMNWLAFSAVGKDYEEYFLQKYLPDLPQMIYSPGKNLDIPQGAPFLANSSLNNFLIAGSSS